MSNRKKLNIILNAINTEFQATKLLLEKTNNVTAIEKLNAIRRQLELKAKNEFCDDLQKLNDGQEIVIN